jgi:hypothetical protein
MPRDFKLFLFLGVFALLESAHATTVSLIPVDNNYAQDADTNGVFDTLATKYSPYFLLHSSLSQSPYLGIEPGDVRSGLEFNISSIPQGSIITSATFSIHNASGYHNSDENPGPFLGQSVSGYVGDGQITLSDFSNLTIVANSMTDDFNVTSLVQLLVNAGNGYAGFIVGQNSLGYGVEEYSLDHAYPGGPAPTLVIQYTVPEASSFALLSLTGVSTLLRRKRSRV